MIWVYCKNMPGMLFWLFLPLHLAANLMSILVLMARGQFRVAYLAKIDALRELPRMLAKRRRIQHARVIAPRDMLKLLTYSLHASQLLGRRN